MRPRLSPSMYRRRGEPNLRSVVLHRSYFASAAHSATAAGGAQTYGCIHTIAHTRVHACHVHRCTHMPAHVYMYVSFIVLRYLVASAQGYCVVLTAATARKHTCPVR